MLKYNMQTDKLQTNQLYYLMRLVGKPGVTHMPQGLGLLIHLLAIFQNMMLKMMSLDFNTPHRNWNRVVWTCHRKIV